MLVLYTSPHGNETASSQMILGQALPYNHIPDSFTTSTFCRKKRILLLLCIRFLLVFPQQRKAKSVWAAQLSAEHFQLIILDKASSSNRSCHLDELSNLNFTHKFLNTAVLRGIPLYCTTIWVGALTWLWFAQLSCFRKNTTLSSYQER